MENFTLKGILNTVKTYLTVNDGVKDYIVPLKIIQDTFQGIFFPTKRWIGVFYHLSGTLILDITQNDFPCTWILANTGTGVYTLTASAPVISATQTYFLTNRLSFYSVDAAYYLEVVGYTSTVVTVNVRRVSDNALTSERLASIPFLFEIKNV